MAEPKSFHIYIISDSTGETAEKMTRAVLSQFKGQIVRVTRHPNVRTEDQLEGILRQAQAESGLVIYTMVADPMRQLLHQEAVKRSIPAVDLLGPLLAEMSNVFHARPEAEPGLLHRVDQAYFKRIEGIQFAVKHDDGQSLPTLYKADLVLVGVSRTGKTPLSMYLAQYGYKVANIPILPGRPLPRQLLSMDQRKIVGLLIAHEKLLQIRKARLGRLKAGLETDWDYVERSAIMSELEYARDLYRQHSEWPVIDATVRAVEEVASEILNIMERKGVLK
jgi:[pyruvate, water dikinase]-phosphate phosphotransferase / [pyruvate, water dikinase] kinase